MEAMRDVAVEVWNHGLLMYRTMLIKAESKRRKAMANTQDESKKCRKVECCKEGLESALVADVSSTMYSCDASEMRRVFDLFDQNKDGHISAEELQLFMKKLGFELSDQKVKDMVGAVDENRDDCIDFEEFLSMYSSLCAMGDDSDSNSQCTNVKRDDEEEEGAILQAFFIFDENKDGLISAVELQQVLLKLGLPEGRSLMGCQKMIERVDANGNGKVDFFEFKDMMCSDAFSLPDTVMISGIDGQWILGNGAGTHDLRQVSGRFDSMEDYVRVLEPLLFEECHAQLHSSWEELLEGSVKDAQTEVIFHVRRSFPEIERSLMSCHKIGSRFACQLAFSHSRRMKHTGSWYLS